MNAPALWVDELKPTGDIGAVALRAPENIVRAECGTEIDIWAIGCLVSSHLCPNMMKTPADHRL